MPKIMVIISVLQIVSVNRDATEMNLPGRYYEVSYDPPYEQNTLIVAGEE